MLASTYPVAPCLNLEIGGNYLPMRHQRRISTLLFAAAAFAVVGCSEDTQDSIGTDVQNVATDVGEAVDEATNDAAEALARNIATQQGEEQFTDAGHPLDGPLECTATVADGVAQIDIACTGVTQDGGDAMLTGMTSEIPGASVVSLEGEFVGTVDGAEVFATDQLGG